MTPAPAGGDTGWMRTRVPVTLAVFGALASGCSNGYPLPTTGAGPTQAAPTPAPTTAGPVAVKLRHFPAGLAAIGLNTSARQLTVEIKVAGLAPGSNHPARLMAGSCAHPGTLLHALDPVVPAGNSIADVTTTVNDARETEIPVSGWYLAVYRGPAAADQGTAIMCGDLDNQARQTVITAGISVLVPPAGPDPQAAGTATLSIVDGQLKVVIDATGLTPRSSHAAQLRKGNCEGEGAVLHPLETLTADVTGHAVSTTMVPGVSGIPLNRWFLGVSPQPSVLDPTVCGNVGT
jgi:hypothetical protein